VKGWAEVYGKPIAAVSGLEAVAAQSHSRGSMLFPVLDARRGQIYSACYRRATAAKRDGLALEGEECVMTPDEFIVAIAARKAADDCSIVTPVPGLIADAVSRYETTARMSGGGIPIEQVSSILAPYVGRLGYERGQRGQVVDALTLDANYIRRSDAELHWKAPSGS
jgi:tRNA A37 threonylcarbamoyladenosine modification protein TsaB